MTRGKHNEFSSSDRNPVTRHPLIAAWLLAGAMLLPPAGTGRAQPALSGHATGFTSVEYYAAPNPQQVKTRMSGAEAEPLAGGLLVIRQLRLQTFNTNGMLQAVVEAPECVYDTTRGLASSAGPLKVQTGDGRIRVEGEGFLWRQSDSFLTISNRVRTTIESEMKGTTAP